MFHLCIGRRASSFRLAAGFAALGSVALVTGCGSSGSDAGDAADARRSDSRAEPVLPAASTPAPGATPSGGSGSSAAGMPAAMSPAGMPPAALPPESGGPMQLATPAGTASEAATPPAPPAAAAQFAACLATMGVYSDCDVLNVAMTQASPARCVQLTLDNCGGYSRNGLSADVPQSWRLASGSVGSSSSPCELGVFYPNNAIVNRATGSVSWDESTRQPSAIELELTLELAGAASGAAGIEVATSAPLEPSPCVD